MDALHAKPCRNRLSAPAESDGRGAAAPFDDDIRPGDADETRTERFGGGLFRGKPCSEVLIASFLVQEGFELLGSKDAAEEVLAVALAHRTDPGDLNEINAVTHDAHAEFLAFALSGFGFLAVSLESDLALVSVFESDLLSPLDSVAFLSFSAPFLYDSDR